MQQYIVGYTQPGAAFVAVIYTTPAESEDEAIALVEPVFQHEVTEAGWSPANFERSSGVIDPSRGVQRLSYHSSIVQAE